MIKFDLNSPPLETNWANRDEDLHHAAQNKERGKKTWNMNVKCFDTFIQLSPEYCDNCCKSFTKLERVSHRIFDSRLEAAFKYITSMKLCSSGVH